MKKIFINFIEWYQKNISLWLKEKNIMCKYYPTCSEYTKQAIEKYGVFKGILLGLWRILKCNPFSKGGYDPLKQGGGKNGLFCKLIWIFIKFYIQFYWKLWMGNYTFQYCNKNCDDSSFRKTAKNYEEEH